MRVRARYYQQFDTDPGLEIPAEAFGGWRSGEIDLDPSRTALAVMHAWDCGTRETHAGLWRAVEYLPRAEAILRVVFPPLLAAARASRLRVYHVAGNGTYYKNLPGYLETVSLAGPPPPNSEPVPRDASLESLEAFRHDRVFPGAHNEPDICQGVETVDFPEEARPAEGENIAEDAHQLAALCRRDGVNHLVYAGFALNWCLLMSPGGMIDMSRRGAMCSVIDQATTAVENRETARVEEAKELGLWRVALAFGFVFDADAFIRALRA